MEFVCGGPFNGGNCPSCSSVGSGNEFVYDPNPYSYNETPNFFNQPPQHQYDTYSYEFCGGNSHPGFDCQIGNTPVFDQGPCYNQDFGFNQPPHYSPSQPQTYSCELCGNDAHYGYDCLPQVLEELADYINIPNWNCPAFYEDDDEEYTIAITPVLPTKEPDNSLSMGDEHLSIIPETELDELIKSSVENLVPIPNESEDFSNIESECDVPVCDNFTNFSNTLLDADDDFSFSDDESFSDEDVPKEIYLNHLFDEEIISTKIDLHHLNSDLIESLLNQDTSVISSPKIDSLLEEFFGELAHIDLIPPGNNETNFDPEEEIRLVEKLLYDNSSPRPSEEFNSENSDSIIESFSPSPIPVKDSDSLMEEIDLFLTLDDSMPSGIENDDYGSEGDILFLEELLSNDSPPENESFHFDVPSSPSPSAKPPDDDEIEPDTGVFTKVMDDISDNSTRELYVRVPNVLPTLSTLSPMFDTLLPFHPKMRTKFISYLIGALKLSRSAPDFEASHARCFVLRSLEL
ncbi:hypothetical protein Tco_0427691 [Tanacetum coccineum]